MTLAHPFFSRISAIFLAAWAVCALAGADRDAMAGVINNYMLKNGRMMTFRLGDHRGTLLTSKHENSVAYDTNLAYIADSGKPCAVLVLVDSVERPEEIDAARARREADQAREAMLQKKSRQEYQLAQASLARAMNRLRVKAREIR